MSYASLETSPYSGARVKLFEVQIGSMVWRLTSSNVPINYAGFIWDAIAGVEHSEIGSDTTAADDGNKVTVKIPFDHEIANLLKLGAPAGTKKIVIYHGHTSGDFIVKWRGKIIEYGIDVPYALIVSESVLASARRLAAGLIVDTGCGVALGSRECGINIESYKLVNTVSAVSGLTVAVNGLAAYADNHFLGGYAKWAHPNIAGAEMMVSILSHSGSNMAVDMPVPTLSAGTVVSIYPNCNKELTGDCHNKYNNSANHRGLFALTRANPFNATRLY